MAMSEALQQAEKSMANDGNARRRAEALRIAIQQLECTFTATANRKRLGY